MNSKVVGILLLVLFVISCSAKKITETNNEINSMDEDSSTVYINQVKLTTSQIKELTETYGQVTPGAYWYDSESGLYGRWYEAPLGYLLPDHQFAPLAEEASNGNTGLFINSRELPEAEVQYLELVLQAQRKGGEYWLDAQGNIGFSGNEQPFANLFLAAAQLQQAYQQSTAGNGQGWSSYYTNSYGNEQNGFGYVVVDGASVTYG